MTQQEQNAVAGSGDEGRRAFYMGLGYENCPYPAIDGVLGEQRKAWIAEFDKAAG